MLARAEDLFAFLFLLGVVIFAGAFLKHMSQARLQKLRILEQAMRDPAVDAATRQQLIAALQRPGVLGPWGAWFRTNFTPTRVFTSAAWIVTVIGLLVTTLGSRYDQSAGIATLAIGIAILALPIVVRELESRGARR